MRCTLLICLVSLPLIGIHAPAGHLPNEQKQYNSALPMYVRKRFLELQLKGIEKSAYQVERKALPLIYVDNNFCFIYHRLKF